MIAETLGKFEWEVREQMGQEEFVHWLAYLRMSGSHGGGGGSGGVQTPTINKFKSKMRGMGRR